MAEMTGFDDRLDRALRAQAARAGESIEVYVQRAVAARLRSDLESSGDPEYAVLLELLNRIVDNTATGSVSSLHPVLDDPARLQALRDTGLLDSDADPSYDHIVSMAVEALGASAAAISLVDDHRQFFKSVLGLPAGVRETPLSHSMCRYAVATGEPLVVEDARVDPVLHDHPAVTDGMLVSYAGIPLIDPAGLAIGTLCVWDDKPHQWSTGHVQILDDLAHIVSERVFSAK
jgi:GAF domain-containing protein